MKKKRKLILVGLDAVSLPLIERFAGEGRLPNIQKLMERGAVNEAMPCLPAYTPTNWATLATGALPGTHGAGNWQDHSPGDSRDRKPLSTFDSRTILCETIWETAERAGYKSLVVSYPGSYPSRLKKGMVVTYLDKGLTSLSLMPALIYTTEKDGPGRTETIKLSPASGWRNAPQGALEARLILDQEGLGGKGVGYAKKTGSTEDGADFEIGNADDEVAPGKVRALYLLVLKSGNAGYNRILICEKKDRRSSLAELRVGQWSRWILKRFYRHDGPTDAAFRFKLLELSPGGRKLRLWRSEACATTGITAPKGLARELIKNVGYYIEHPGAGAFAWRKKVSLRDTPTVMEEVNYQVDWHLKAAQYLKKKKGWDIYYTHWHFPDTVEHGSLAPADPDSPGYDKKKAPAYLDILRKTYEAGDRYVGGMLMLADKDTYVVVVSDHGNCSVKYLCNLYRMLSDAGLTRFPGDKYEVKWIPGENKWAGSRAYPLSASQICVNLKGRDPDGVVEPEDYEKVQEEIIDALYSWKEPETGKRAIALALKKKDAQLIGYWGKPVGDVIFFHNPGFGWIGNPGDKTSIIKAEKGGAYHGPQLPTARTRLSSNLAAFIIAGPGIRKGYRRDPEKLGYVRLVDVVPTLAHLLEFNPPRHSQGAVLWDFLE